MKSFLQKCTLSYSRYSQISVTFFITKISCQAFYIRGPQPPGRGPVSAHSVLGTGPHSRRWAAGKWGKLHLPLPIAHITAWTVISNPQPTPTPPIRGKIVFHETSPWCQKGWGPLFCMTKTSIWRQLFVCKSFDNVTFVFLLGRGEQLKDKTRIFIYSTNVCWVTTHIKLRGRYYFLSGGHCDTLPKSPFRTEGLIPPTARSGVDKTALSC